MVVSERTYVLQP